MGEIERRKLGGKAKVHTNRSEVSNVASQQANRTLRKPKKTSYLCYFASVIVTAFAWISWERLALESLGSALYHNKGIACLGYDGVLHIAQGDVEGAAGTIFFLFVLNQILYAEKHNLIPFIHLNNVSKYVYDPTIHGSVPTSATVARGVNASWVNYVDPITNNRFSYAGRPIRIQKTLSPELYTVYGTGVWNNYFEPVSGFSFDDKSPKSTASTPNI